MTNILETFGNQKSSSILYLFTALDISHYLKNSRFISKFILGKLVYCSHFFLKNFLKKNWWNQKVLLTLQRKHRRTDGRMGLTPPSEYF